MGDKKYRILIIPVLLLIPLIVNIASAMSTSENQIIQKEGGGYVMRARVPSKMLAIEQAHVVLNKMLDKRAKVNSILSITHSGSDSSHISKYICVVGCGYITLDSYLYASWYLSNPLDYDHVTVSDTWTEAAWLGINPYNADEIDYTSQLSFHGFSISVSAGIPPSASVSIGWTSATITYSHNWKNLWWARINWDYVKADGIYIYKVGLRDTAAFVFGHQSHILSDSLGVTWIH